MRTPSRVATHPVGWLVNDFPLHTAAPWVGENVRDCGSAVPGLGLLLVLLWKMVMASTFFDLGIGAAMQDFPALKELDFEFVARYNSLPLLRLRMHYGD
jgi:hypothetical protein